MLDGRRYGLGKEQRGCGGRQGRRELRHVLPHRNLESDLGRTQLRFESQQRARIEDNYKEREGPDSDQNRKTSGSGLNLQHWAHDLVTSTIGDATFVELTS
jgi:hypothetical protein